MVTLQLRLGSEKSQIRADVEGLPGRGNSGAKALGWSCLVHLRSSRGWCVWSRVRERDSRRG